LGQHKGFFLFFMFFSWQKKGLAMNITLEKLGPKIAKKSQK